MGVSPQTLYSISHSFIHLLIQETCPEYYFMPRIVTKAALPRLLVWRGRQVLRSLKFIQCNHLQPTAPNHLLSPSKERLWDKTVSGGSSPSFCRNLLDCKRLRERNSAFPRGRWILGCRRKEIKGTWVPCKVSGIWTLPHFCFRQCFLTQGIEMRAELKEVFCFYPC